MKNTSPKSNIVGTKELRQNLDKYISQVNKGRSFIIVRRSKPVFKISPIDEWGDDRICDTGIDLREINRQGVSAKDILKVLKKWMDKINKLLKKIPTSE